MLKYIKGRYISLYISLIIALVRGYNYYPRNLLREDLMVTLSEVTSLLLESL